MEKNRRVGEGGVRSLEPGKLIHGKWAEGGGGGGQDKGGGRNSLSNRGGGLSRISARTHARMGFDFVRWTLASYKKR